MIDQIVQDIRNQGWSYQHNVVDNSRLNVIQSLFEGEFLPARVGKDHDRKRVEEIRTDWIHWLDPLVPPRELEEEIQFLDFLKNALNKNFYLGLKEFECHLAKYPIGSFYKKHLDRFNKDSSRSISFIFYLHEQWEKDDGGELVIYDRHDNLIKTILPEPGSFICFLSDDFPHEVKVCARERRSLTGWMHTKILN